MLYPIVTETRTVIDLSGIWNFKLDNGSGFAEEWHKAPLKDPISMAVPASFNDIGVTSDIRNHVGWVWYERDFTVPNRLFSQRIVLRFGSATHKAKVYVNGNLVVEHAGGFTPFEAEIRPYLQSGKNRLTVAVNNIVDETTLPVGMYSEREVSGIGKVVRNYPYFDFFNYAGLHRPVKIYTTPDIYIKDVAVVTDFDGTTGIVRYETVAEGDADVKVTVLDQSGDAVASSSGPSGVVHIHNVRLWEPLNAYLYTLRLELVRDGEVIDVYELPFGVRTVEVKDGQFLINRKPFYFKGFGKHEDTPISGRGFHEAANVMDFRLMKWMGANSFRTAHYPYSEELMRLADREGFVVIDEVPAVGMHLNMNVMLHYGNARKTWEELKTQDHHRDVIRELIARDKNHPCVVLWSIANEPASEEEGAYEYFRPLVELAKELDPQKRPVTIVTQIRATPEHDRVADLVDVLALNRYYGWYVHGGEFEMAKMMLRQELDGWRKRCPDKPIIMTEYGADTIAGLHDVDPVMFTEEFQVEFLRANHDVFDACPNLVGEHVWNFADFQTSQSIIRVQGNKKGVFTRDRKPKYAAHELRKRWLSIPDFGYKSATGRKG
ncbi:beta-galactosidase/beta-glucuronidase [Thermobacillus composti KWC4]|uniref:Beta-glucuronidase n=1 Tax=Thermobacillus composti (strain DSM 18247 / JCM 13945 / KWC4) TaxID=717605 RepID=L0EGU5_THECK|nr:beta-glucuronidase [Thermobacillus composti]AGA59022.1 beta-galactosidase/beta-glucuronidase [Thermobacillus composti KWC4]